MDKHDMRYVYIIERNDKKLYAGVTNEENSR